MAAQEGATYQAPLIQLLIKLHTRPKTDACGLRPILDLALRQAVQRSEADALGQWLMSSSPSFAMQIEVV